MAGNNGSRFGFVRNPYRGNDTAQSSRPQRRDMSSDAKSEKKEDPGTIVNMQVLWPVDAEIKGARISNFGKGGAYLTVYAEVNGVPVSYRQGTFDKRVSATQAQKFVDDLKAGGMKQSRFEAEVTTRNGEVYDRELVGLRQFSLDDGE